MYTLLYILLHVAYIIPRTLYERIIAQMEAPIIGLHYNYYRLSVRVSMGELGPRQGATFTLQMP